MDLVEAADRQVRTYSGGMRRRLDLGASLVGSPRLLLLDEPTTGLDPGSRNEVWDAVHAMSQSGTDIVLTTQYLDEADHLATSIVIIDGGRVIAQGTPNELKSRVGADMVELHTVDVPTMQRAAEVLASLGMAEPSTDPAHAPVLARRAGRLEVAARSSCAPSTRPRCRWRTSRCAGPPSTRCSSPSPGTHRPTRPTTPRRTQHDHHPRPTRPDPADPRQSTNQGASFLVATEQVAAAHAKEVHPLAGAAHRRARRRGCSSCSSSATSSAGRWATPGTCPTWTSWCPGSS